MGWKKPLFSHQLYHAASTAWGEYALKCGWASSSSGWSVFFSPAGVVFSNGGRTSFAGLSLGFAAEAPFCCCCCCFAAFAAAFSFAFSFFSVDAIKTFVSHRQEHADTQLGEQTRRGATHPAWRTWACCSPAPRAACPWGPPCLSSDYGILARVGLESWMVGEE